MPSSRQMTLKLLFTLPSFSLLLHEGLNLWLDALEHVLEVELRYDDKRHLDVQSVRRGFPHDAQLGTYPAEEEEMEANNHAVDVCHRGGDTSDEFKLPEFIASDVR